MRFLLIILLFFISCVVKSQVVADTAIYVQSNGDSVKVVAFKNTGTSPFATNAALALKQDALGFTPYNATNPSGFISGITSLMVTNALTFTPLATNGNGSSLTGLTKTQVGLANADNTSDANKPVSSAAQTALNLKANLASPTFTGTVSGITATMVGLGNVTNESKATMFTSPTFTGSPVVPGYQPLATNLTSIGALANGSGYLRNNGSGTFTYETPAGAGTVTNTGNLTANSLVLGNGTTDTKVVAGITSDGTSQITLGVVNTTLGSVRMFGNTSGNVTLRPAAVAGTDVTVTLPNVTSTLLPNSTTSGVAATPTASGTVTITHNLGRIPTIIRIYSISSFTSNAAATPVPFSMGTFNSTGNRCLYMVINGTTTQVSQTSTVFSIIMVTSAGNQITGVIQNLTSTQFDIVFTETGTHTAGNYLWECQ